MKHHEASLEDSQLRVEGKAAEGSVQWLSPLEEPFRISGFGWFQEDGRYRRLPTLPPGELPEAVDRLADHTSGGQIRFRTNSTSLSVRVKLKGRADMAHMTAIGQCGMDCYAGDFGEMKYVNSTMYNQTLTEYESVLFTDLEPRMRGIVLNMPLYQGVEEIWIGLDAQAELSPPPDYTSDKRVIIYGTSITQGGCASRPGMAYPNILSRRIPLEFLNLGFSGSGRGEPEVARVIARIAKPACLVLDYEANAVSTELYRTTLPEFIRIFREVHHAVPILVVSRIRYAREHEDRAFYEERLRRKAFQQELVRELREAGDSSIFFTDGSELLGGEDYHECAVDGIHPTDLGFMRMANGLEPILRTLVW